MCSGRLQCCEENLSLYREHGQRFLSNNVTVDERPLTSIIRTESERESSEWCFVNEFAPRKLWSGSSRRRCLMFPVFWGSQCVIKVDFADKSVKFNNEYYASLICETRAERSKPRGSPLWLLQDNASIHTSQVTKKTIQEANFHLLQHPPYSPDLALSDFWLFRHVKKHLRSHQFSSANCAQQAMRTSWSHKLLTFILTRFLSFWIGGRSVLRTKGHMHWEINYFLLEDIVFWT